MYRMMIVDDQMREIEGIKRILDWSLLGIEIVGTARNGKEGVEEALRLKPDIIITDIVMHSMDGLEMANIINQSLPQVKFLFISCFDDFKFVSRAINNGAYGYVLKPILPGELQTAIMKIMNVCEKEKRNYELILQKQKINESISILKESFYKNLLLGLFENEKDILSQGNFFGINISACVYAVGCIELECNNEEENIFFHGVRISNILSKQYENDQNVFVILMDMHHIALLLCEDRDSVSKIRKNLIAKIQDALDFIEKNFDISASAGIGSSTTDLRGISLSYRESLKALQFKFYYSRQQVIDIQDVSFNFEEFKLDIASLNENLKHIIFSGEKDMVKGFVDSLLNTDAPQDTLKYIVYTVINTIQLILLQTQQNMEIILGSYKDIINCISSLKNIEELREWLIKNIVYIINYIVEKNKYENMDIVLKMEDYIRNNFYLQIMLQDVADYVFLSPSYANHLYKSVYGKTVHQRIEELRLELAAKLLIDKKDMKIFKIAEKAGYCNSSYFINVFKKAYGCTPADYRRKKFYE